MKFSEAAINIYVLFEAIMFGVEIIQNDSSQIYLNPSNLVLEFKNDEKIYGYIISEDKKVAEDISNFKLTKEEKQKIQFQKLKKRRNQIFNDDIYQGLQQNMQMDHYNAQIISQRMNDADFIESGGEDYMDSQEKFNNGMIKKSSEFEMINSQTSSGSDSDVLLEDDILSNRNKINNNNVQTKQTSYKNILTSEQNKWFQECYTTKERINLKDVTFKTLQNNILAIDHIILCGLENNLLNFLIPLRSKYLQKYPTIVILNEEPPSEKQWKQVCSFPEIYYVKGSALVKNDLKRANIEQAKQIVILTPNVSILRKQGMQKLGSNQISDQKNSCQDQHQGQAGLSYQELSKEEEDLLDAKTIFKYKAVKSLRPDILIVTELVKPSNFAFLLSTSEDYALMREYGYNNTPLFASGEVYLSSVMDSLCCQAYYNNALITVINLLLLGQDDLGNKESKSSKKNKSRKKIINSNLFNIKVPESFLGQTFRDLFVFLAKNKSIIPIGLYRMPGASDNKLSYAWTNPRPLTILTKFDQVLILSPEKPDEDVNDWGGPLEQKQKKNFDQNFSPNNNNMSQQSKFPSSKNTAFENNLKEFPLLGADKMNYNDGLNQADVQILEQKIQGVVNQVSVLQEESILGEIKDLISEELSKVIGVNSGIENDLNENKEEKELKLNLNENLNFENMMPNSQNLNLGQDNNI
ncbi:hypothetical protein PPERSA_04188 [Pseudocohnilembus persalinus]|uniref:RCK N-terminal domain-containing protein n=1 Tax=Pseudocohnilembus persalinus TaxID=266149 RepID=A0A0V0QN29_PSEPJ|nr:hypothetical protein PPERSA_04188 [Pseudocohnilembus persalinus]|eukprot:KRX03636.1 hypothetical protein PPERSA_04188 [Pseudocohnilembus persalinus]